MPDPQELRAARNGYNSAVKAAEGFIGGQRIYALKVARKRLEALLWAMRDDLVDAVSTPI